MKFTVFISFLFVLTAAAWSQESKENADFKLAVRLYDDRLYDLALEQFRQFVAAYPNTQQGVEARYYLGLTQRALALYEEARFTFQNFALSFPSHPKAPEAWWNVAESYVKLGNPGEAALAFERVKTFHPKSTLAPEALLKASGYFKAAGDMENSKKALRALTQEYGSSSVVQEARLRLGHMYFDENQFEPARAEASRVAESTTDPNRATDALQLVAASLGRLGRLEEAKKALNEIITKYKNTPSYFDALLALAQINAESGTIDEARSLWTQIIDSRGSAPAGVRESAFLARGDADALQEKFADAYRSFESAAEIHGTRWGEASFKTARVAERLGRTASAGEWYLKAVGDSVGTFDRRSLLAGAVHGARLLKNFNMLVRYAQQYRNLYSSDSETPSVLLEMAAVYLNELNDARHAQDWYEEIAADFPGSELADDALLGLARALRARGESADALQVLGTLHRRFPASGLLDESRDLEFEIQTFDQKNKEGGVENLALLSGDVIAGKPKAELAYRLGEIYFNDLKNYALAVQQYDVALQSGLSGPLAPMAWYRRARAAEYQAWPGKKEKAAEAVSVAIAAYDSLLLKNPEFPFRDEALLSRVKLKIENARNISDLRRLSDEIRKEVWSDRGKEKAFLELARAYQGMKSNNDAALVLGELLKMKPSPPVGSSALFLLAQSRLELGERDSAAVLFEKYLNENPAGEYSARAALQLIQFAVEKKRTRVALGLCDVLEQQFFYADAARGLDLLRGDAFYAAGDIPNALNSYRRYVGLLEKKVFPRADLPLHLISRLADCYRQTGDRTTAKMYYGRLLAADTSSSGRSQTNYVLASIAREENNLELAARYLDASRLGATSAELRQKTALEELELLLKSDDYKTALLRMEELLPQVKSDSLQRFLESRMVVAYFRLDNLAEADKRSNTFLRANPKASEYAAEFEYERGRYHLRKEETDLAIRRLQNVRARYPRSSVIPEDVYWLARAFEMKGDLQRAVQLYDSLMHRFPSHPILPRVQLSLGNVYYNLEQWDSAAQLYKMIVDNGQTAPDLVQYALSNLIMAYKEIGLFDAALQMTRQYIERYPDDPDLLLKRIDLGVIYQKLGYYDQSILHLQSMLENADPDLEAELRYYIGEAYFYKGEYQQAILEFLKVPYLITHPTKIDWVATSYYMAGQAYEKMSKFDQAITMYKQIIERPGVDATFKTAAQKEIDRVNMLVKGDK